MPGPAAGRFLALARCRAGVLPADAESCRSFVESAFRGHRLEKLSRDEAQRGSHQLTSTKRKHCPPAFASVDAGFGAVR